MKGILNDFVSHFRRNFGELPDNGIQGFLRVLESVRVQDMPCSEVFARLDEYVEKELSGQEAAKLMPLLREHFDICPDCCEEYKTLLIALEQASRDGQAEGHSGSPSI
jgi:hypothetical protein